MKTKKLGFIGGGRITRIFLQAFRNKLVKFDSITVFEPNSAIRKELKNQFPDIESVDSPEIVARQDIVILAVHPPVMMETLHSIKGIINKESVILSLAPKITMDKMASLLPTRKIVRMIPNATSVINEGYNPVSFYDSFLIEEKKRLMDIFQILGTTLEVKECKLEGYAIVSAMLPTYFWFQWKKMEEIAVQTGLTYEEAVKTIKETVDRSLKLFYESGLTSEEVMDLIPVKPIVEKEEEIKSIFESKLMGLFEKIRPNQ
jgi:pyrroline-5-carboxylate reductase